MSATSAGAGGSAASLRHRDLILDAVVRAAGLLFRDPGAAGGIDAALAEIGESAGAGCSYILEQEGGNGNRWRAVHAWAATGAALPCDVVAMPESGKDGGILRLGRSDGCQGSCILLPLEVDDGWSCYLSLDTLSPERDWSRYEREALKAAARVIGAALTCRRGRLLTPEDKKNTENKNAEGENSPSELRS